MVFKAFLGHNHDAAEAKKRALALATSQDRWLIWVFEWCWISTISCQMSRGRKSSQQSLPLALLLRLNSCVIRQQRRWPPTFCMVRMKKTSMSHCGDWGSSEKALMCWVILSCERGLWESFLFKTWQGLEDFSLTSMEWFNSISIWTRLCTLRKSHQRFPALERNARFPQAIDSGLESRS